MIKTLKSNSGLSLMEILVAGLMFGILAVTVVLVISPIMMAYSRANSLAEYNTILDSIGNVITSEFSGANHVEDYGPNSLEFSTGSGDVTFYVVGDRGHLRRKDSRDDSSHLVFPVGFYGGMLISFDVEYESPGFLITVRVRPSDSPHRPGIATADISRKFAVRPIMLG